MNYDGRALAWRLLLPVGTGYDVASGPDWWRGALAESSEDGGSRTLVCWDSRPGAATGRSLTSYDAVVAANVTGLTGAALSGAGFVHHRHFAVVPGLHNPRWFIPLDSGTVSARALGLYTPFDGIARAMRAGAWMAARARLPLWYRDSIWVAQRTPSPVERFLYRTLDERTLPIAISTGTPGPARKPTLALLGSNGRIRALAKLSRSQLSHDLLRHEAECLNVLPATLGTSLAMPRLLDAIDVDDRYVTVQEALPGRPPRAKLTADHAHFLAKLSSGPHRPAISTALVSEFAARIDAADSMELRLRPVLARVRTLLADAMFPRTVVHGDFGPWNLRRHYGRLGAFDWEYCHIDGLPLLDEIHHRLQVGFLLKGWSEERAFDELVAQRMTARDGIAPSHVLGLQLVYLLDVLLRRCEEGHPTDEHLRQRYVQLLHRMMATPNEAAR